MRILVSKSWHAACTSSAFASPCGNCLPHPMGINFGRIVRTGKLSGPFRFSGSLSEMSQVSSVPVWFCRGCFRSLSKKTKPSSSASVFSMIPRMLDSISSLVRIPGMGDASELPTCPTIFDGSEPLMRIIEMDWMNPMFPFSK